MDVEKKAEKRVDAARREKRVRRSEGVKEKEETNNVKEKKENGIWLALSVSHVNMRPSCHIAPMHNIDLSVNDHDPLLFSLIDLRMSK